MYEQLMNKTATQPDDQWHQSIGGAGRPLVLFMHGLERRQLGR